MIVALDCSAIGHSERSSELPHSEGWQRQAVRQIGAVPGFESFIACGQDGGTAIAAEAAAWAGPACLGLIMIRSQTRVPESSSDISLDHALPNLRCPILVLHGELGEFDPVGVAGLGSAHGTSGGEMISTIREFLALRVFPLPIH
ncbi:hypothetical protein [Bosea sp. ASV33]|uniref:hypothetical protein n=1 Tax=Bosea sp. ASV33 TaxID=2795106 RepID=UPI0018EBF12B|nr:hypothetical protein [Bosea sp. ASV33]